MARTATNARTRSHATIQLRSADFQGWRFSTFMGIPSVQPKLFTLWPLSLCASLALARRGSSPRGPTRAHSPPTGTICLWIFWPSFASATTTQDSAEPWAVLNLYFSLAASTLATVILWPILYEEGTLQVVGPPLRQSQALVHPIGTGSMMLSKGTQGDAGLLSWVG